MIVRRAVRPFGGVDRNIRHARSGVDQLAAKLLIELVGVVRRARAVAVEQSEAALTRAADQQELRCHIHLLGDQASQHVTQPDGVVERVGRGLAADGVTPVRVELGDRHGQIPARFLLDDTPQVLHDAVPGRRIGTQFGDPGWNLVGGVWERIAVERHDVHRIAVDFRNSRIQSRPLLSLGSQAGLPVNWCVSGPEEQIARIDGFHRIGKPAPHLAEAGRIPLCPLALTLFVKARLVADGPKLDVVAFFLVRITYELSRFFRSATHRIARGCMALRPSSRARSTNVST